VSIASEGTLARLEPQPALSTRHAAAFFELTYSWTSQGVASDSMIKRQFYFEPYLVLGVYIDIKGIELFSLALEEIKFRTQADGIA
jgi:hypothetical protein